MWRETLSIVVKPEHRGRGHGKRLLEFAVALGEEGSSQERTRNTPIVYTES